MTLRTEILFDKPAPDLAYQQIMRWALAQTTNHTYSLCVLFLRMTDVPRS